MPKEGKVIVDGVNLAKKHQKATRATMQGGIIDKDMPMSASAVAIVCGDCGPTRVGYSSTTTASRCGSAGSASGSCSGRLHQDRSHAAPTRDGTTPPPAPAQGALRRRGPRRS